MHLAGLVLMASSSTEWSTLGDLRRMRGGRGGRGGGKEVVGEVQGRVGVAAGREKGSSGVGEGRGVKMRGGGGADLIFVTNKK